MQLLVFGSLNIDFIILTKDNFIMKPTLFIFCGILFLYSCKTSVDDMTGKSASSSKKVWVDMELEVKKKLDTIDYYYVGQIDENTLKELKLNKPGLFELSNIRFYRNDSIFKYEDDAEEGIVYFNRRDVVKLTILKQDPYLDSTEERH